MEISGNVIYNYCHKLYTKFVQVLFIICSSFIGNLLKKYSNLRFQKNFVVSFEKMSNINGDWIFLAPLPFQKILA